MRYHNFVTLTVIFMWRFSSVGRAEAWRALCPQFESGRSHQVYTPLFSGVFTFYKETQGCLVVTFRDPATTSYKTSFQELVALRIAAGNSHPDPFGRKFESIHHEKTNPFGLVLSWWVMRDFRVTSRNASLFAVDPGSLLAVPRPTTLRPFESQASQILGLLH